MTPSLDRALWHLLHERQTSVHTLAALYVGIAVAIAISCFIVLERRTRSRWLKVPASSVIAGDGPYRRGPLGTFLTKAPMRVRMTSLAGIIIGTIGLVWPVLLIMNLLTWWLGWSNMMLVEAAGTATTVLLLVSAVNLLRRPNHVVSERRARVLRIAAALLFLASVAYLLHAFDGLEVMAYGIKWREQTTLGAFTRTGFAGFVDGHVGLAWRVVLRAASIFGVLSSGFIVLYARAVASVVRGARAVADERLRDRVQRVVG